MVHFWLAFTSSYATPTPKRGICAVIVYPMNALAEDQLGRLRELLAGSGITFGMYVGKTPERQASVTGKRLPPGSSHADYVAQVEALLEAGDPSLVHPPRGALQPEAMRPERLDYAAISKTSGETRECVRGMFLKAAKRHGEECLLWHVEYVLNIVAIVSRIVPYHLILPRAMELLLNTSSQYLRSHKTPPTSRLPHFPQKAPHRRKRKPGTGRGNRKAKA